MTEKEFGQLYTGEEITGLPSGTDFFRPIQERLPRLGRDWCIISIQIEHFRYYTDWF